MKQSVLRFAAQLWAMLAVLLLFVAAALPAHADDGDMDEITHYTVTVDTRADGSADITYELDWNVIGGSLDEPLTWVRIGLPNSHNDSLVNLTPDTVLNVSSGLRRQKLQQQTLRQMQQLLKLKQKKKQFKNKI